MCRENILKSIERLVMTKVLLQCTHVCFKYIVFTVLL